MTWKWLGNYPKSKSWVNGHVEDDWAHYIINTPLFGKIKFPKDKAAVAHVENRIYYRNSCNEGIFYKIFKLKISWGLLSLLAQVASTLSTSNGGLRVSLEEITQFLEICVEHLWEHHLKWRHLVRVWFRLTGVISLLWFTHGNVYYAI